MRRCSTSLITKEMQIKMTLRYNLTLIKMAIIKKSRDDKYWWGYGVQALIQCWWECRLVLPLWQTVWRFINSKIELYISYFECFVVYNSELIALHLLSVGPILRNIYLHNNSFPTIISIRTTWRIYWNIDYNSVDLGWDLRVSVSNLLTDDAYALGPQTTLWVAWSYICFSFCVC